MGFAQKKASGPRPPRTVKDIERLSPQDTYALPWAVIPDSNIVWKRRVWRTIDVSAKGNEPLMFDKNNQVDNNFINILVQGVFNNRYKAYSGANDRFTDELPQSAFIGLIAGGITGADTGFRVGLVTRYRIMEDWMLVKNEKQIIARLVGIAPLYNTAGADGALKEVAAFWVYYPDARSFMSEHRILTGTADQQEMNWDRFLDRRKFNSVAEKMSVSGADKKKI